MVKDFFSLKQNSYSGVKLLSRLRLKFSHMNEYKICHNFKDVLNSSIHVEGTGAKLSIFFNCVLRKQKELGRTEKKTKKENKKN